MDRAEFDRTTHRMGEALGVLLGLDLAGYLEVLERDEAFGCYLDSPRAWQDRRAVCDRLRELARAALGLRNAHARAMEQAEAEVQKEARRRAEGGGGGR